MQCGTITADQNIFSLVHIYVEHCGPIWEGQPSSNVTEIETKSE